MMRQLVNGIMSGVATSTIAVRVQANASRNEFVGAREGLLVVGVAAPALDVRANRAVCRLLANRLDVPPSMLTACGDNVPGTGSSKSLPTGSASDHDESGQPSGRRPQP